MHLQWTCRTTALLLVTGLAGGLSVHGDERVASDLLPSTTVFYAELNDPPGLITQLLEHPLREQLQNLDVYQQLLEDPKYTQFQTQRQGVEVLLGYQWQEIVDVFAAGGTALAFDPQTEGACLLLKSRDPKALNKVLVSLLALVRQDARSKGRPDPIEETRYRDVAVYKAEKAGLAVHDGWLVFVNNAPLGQQILDALLDGADKPLAREQNFLDARQQIAPEAVAWAYLDLNFLRQMNSQSKGFSGKADDPGGELILGGVLDALTRSPWLNASLNFDEDRLGLQFRMPHRPEWISEEREHFFGPQGQGTAPAALDVPDALFALTAYRNVSEMWLRAGDLFDEKVNDSLAQAEGTLATLFSGRNFAEDVLGEISPKVQILAARQRFDPLRPVPDIKLPAFALVAEMKNPETTSPSFRRIFQSLIGFLNIVGAQNAQPQLELGREQIGDAEVVTATFVPDAAIPVEQQTAINFNFSPSIAFAGNRLIVSSTSYLALTLVEAAPLQASQGAERINSQLTVDAAPLRAILDDNRSHLIAQNMLKEGHSHEEADVQVQTLLDLLNLLDRASVALQTSQSTLNLDLGIEFREQR
jgi:hypothetical protein